MGFNWRNALNEYARIAGVLAGFCVSFIALVLKERVGDFSIWANGPTYGQITVLLFGCSVILFVQSAGRFLQAKEFDVFSIPQPYREFLKDHPKHTEAEWDAFEDEQTRQCRYHEKVGRSCYNFALILMFAGFYFAAAPYNTWVAIFISGIGMLLEAYQILQDFLKRFPRLRKQQRETSEH
jgi:hypothetical protein